MKRSSILGAWNKFFFEPQSPIPIALFRMVYGILIIANLVLLHADWLAWYGTHAWIRLSTMQHAETGIRLNLFSIMPMSDTWVIALFWIFMTAAFLLTIGLLTRLNSVVVFICLASVQQRNLYMLHAGDTFLRVAGFFLMFAPASAAFSLDRVIRRKRGKEGMEIEPRLPWSQRMIQFELALLYFAAFCSKIQGADWVQGNALFYIYHVEELRRFPLPSFFLNPLFLKVTTWFTLLVELAWGLLVWIKPLRYYILVCGLLLHLGLEYSLNIPLFQWEVLSGYLLFIDPSDFRSVSSAFRPSRAIIYQ